MKKLLEINEIATLQKSQQFLNYQRYQFQIFIAQIENLNEDSVKISDPYFIYFLRNKPSKSVIARSGRAGLSFQTIQLVLNRGSLIKSPPPKKKMQLRFSVATLFRFVAHFAHVGILNSRPGCSREVLVSVSDFFLWEIFRWAYFL